MRVIPPARTRRLTLWALALALVFPFGAGAEGVLFTVSYRSAEGLYVAGGTADGLVPGARLEVEREGEVIAELEVVYASERSASCRLLVERRVVVEGDVARLPDVGSSRSTAAPADDLRTETAVELAPASTAAVARAWTGNPRSAELALDGRPVTPLRWQSRGTRGVTTRSGLGGTLGISWESASEGRGDETLESGRLSGRLDLRARDLGGLPYEFRARARTQQNRRGDGERREIESRDRFYELSLTYDPPQGRYAYRVGRMSASPFVGIGYFDGVLGQFALSSIFEVGAFAGSSPEIEETGFSTSRPKYGLFGRFTAATTDSGFPWEVVVAGIREHGETDVSREYVTLQTRYAAGSRWTLFQRAEVDLNRGWREELSGSSSQLSNFSLSATARLSRYGRLSLAYDRYEQYYTEQTRELPEDLLRDLQRQGLRVNLLFGNPRRVNFALTGSLREQSGEAAETLSYGFWVRHGRVTPWKLSMGFNYTAYSNEFTSGYLTTLRTSKRIRAGHQFDLTLGSRLSGSEIFADDADQRTNWARLQLWFELPGSFYSTSEVELTEGALEGRRLSTGLGYRF